MKYIALGGFMPSANDRDVHWISAERVAFHHHLNPKEGLFLSSQKKEDVNKVLFVLQHNSNLPIYCPKFLSYGKPSTKDDILNLLRGAEVWRR